MITFIAQHQFWTAVAGYWILPAAVSLLPEAAPFASCFALSRSRSARACASPGSKIPGLNCLG